MLFPIQTVTDLDPRVTNDESDGDDDGKHAALMKANFLMNIYFDN